MILKKVLPFTHQLLRESVTDGDIAIDATVGNGNDTALLAELVGPNGFVYGFDIQDTAIVNTTNRLQERELLKQVRLVQQSHSEVRQVVREEHLGKIAAAVFNLGYLPGGDKEIVTVPETTLTAVKDLLSMMKKGGVIVLVVYHGHEGGKAEKDALLSFVSEIDQKEAAVLKYEFLNQKNNPPFIIAIEKKG